MVMVLPALFLERFRVIPGLLFKNENVLGFSKVSLIDAMLPILTWYPEGSVWTITRERSCGFAYSPMVLTMYSASLMSMVPAGTFMLVALSALTTRSKENL